MWKTIIKNKQQKLSNQGFITIEIIIALLIAFGFLMVSLQTLVLGMVFKVKAQEEQKANKLIQEDVEAIRNQANANVLTSRLATILTNNDDLSTGFDRSSEPIDDVCNATSYNEGYGQALWFAYTNQDYDASNSNRYSSPLIDNSDLNNDGSVDPDPMDSGDNISTNPNYTVNPTMPLITTAPTGKTLTLNRSHVTATTGVEPFRTLGIFYQVTKPDEDGDGNPDVVASRYVEVIPDEALECP